MRRKPTRLRNEFVEAAVDGAIEMVDSFIGGRRLSAPPPRELRVAVDEQLGRAASVRVASLFFAFYSTVDASWDCDHVPVGSRGKYGDKRLSEQLTQRNVTLHGATVAFGENLGWKGNVSNVRLSSDPKFQVFAAALKAAASSERFAICQYMASKFADSRRVFRPLPPVGDDVLTFARAKKLLFELLALPTEGHVQQLLVAALLYVHRRRYGMIIRTHHPHASDTSDDTAGDIEEFHEGTLLRAYEVTVRPDWKNRLSSFSRKMDKHGLRKYIIIASGVNKDEELAIPASLIAFLEPVGRDVAVVDIMDFATVFAAELTATELLEAVNLAFDFLRQPALCGRVEFQEAYQSAVGAWLDEVSS